MVTQKQSGFIEITDKEKLEWAIKYTFIKGISAVIVFIFIIIVATYIVNKVGI